MAYKVLMTSALVTAPAGHQPVGRRHSIYRDSVYALLLERVPGPAIIKGLVEAHGGRIRVESGDGSGSRFLVRLHRDGAPPVRAAPTGSVR